MSYCVMNIKKQGRSAVYGLQIEANRKQNDGREFYNSDIDQTKTNENIFLRHCENWNREITQQIKAAGCKERKDSIVMLTGVYTASPEWFDQHDKDEWMEYFKDCLEYHDRTYGRAFNAVIHLDEKTPHMQVASIPLIEDGKGWHLSAKMVIGGRSDMRVRQDQFYEQVGQCYDLERGERRDPAEIKAHTTKREWQIATQEERLERAKQETAREQAKTQEVIDRRQASIDRANEQRLEALRERDVARAGRDVTKALNEARNAVLCPVSTEVDILAEKDAKRSVWGKETPATVTISRGDLERLQKQAEANEQTRRAAVSMMESLQEMKQAALDANENRIDKQAAADAAAMSEEGRRADGLERELSRTRKALSQEKQNTASLSEQLTASRATQQEMQEVLAFFPDRWDEMKRKTERARQMEKAYEQRYSTSWGKAYVPFKGQDVDIRSFLREYLNECERQGIPHLTEMAEHFENLLSLDREERGLTR